MAQILDLYKKNTDSFPYIYEENLTIPLSNGGLVRCNIYRPHASEHGAKFPVIATYGPYGKDIPYSDFHAASFSQVNPEHQTEHSSWETPTPRYWTEHGYVVLRADEVGSGQSPGILDVSSSSTTDAFVEVIEWAARQDWSTGKVGLLGLSYFAATQWQVAARKPEGLAAMIPWEGFSDRYRDSARHGGIMSNRFLGAWWNRQILSNQYGVPGRAARKWGPDTIEGDLSEEELRSNRVDGVDAVRENPYRDSPAFAEGCGCDLQDITVPFLSVANWGGYLLHLRGNVQGYMHASSEFKFLRFIVGRHDLPFYYPEEVEIQRSFLDAFLKGEDRDGWTAGKPPVDLVLRRGDVGYNDPIAEKQFLRREENEWPIARTQWTKFFLHQDNSLSADPPSDQFCKLGYRTFGTEEQPHSLNFTTAPFKSTTEITGHIVVSLNVSVSKDKWETAPSDIDLFVTLRHYKSGKEVNYTDSLGGPAALTKGSLRVSLRQTNPNHPHHRSWLPYRDYYSTSVLPVVPGDIYPVDVEIWPTNVVLEEGDQLAVEISSRDTAGTGVFVHDDPVDRPEKKFKGWNHLTFGKEYINYVLLPIIPEKERETGQ